MKKQTETKEMRKQAEEKLRREKDWAQKYLDVARVMTVVIDADKKVSLINRKGCEILGFQEKDIIGKNWFDNFIPERMRDEVGGVFGKLMAGKIEPVEYFENPVLTKTGEERIIAWHNTVLTDDTGTISGALNSGEDITERKRAEEALRRMGWAIEATSDGVGIADTTGRSIYHNRALADLLGYSPEELNAAGGLPAVYVDPSVAREMLDALEKGGSWTGEVQMKTRAGCEVTIFLRFNSIKDAEGTIIGHVGLHTDITERKRAEDELRAISNKILRSQEEDRSTIASELHDEIGQSLTVLKLLLNRAMRSPSEGADSILGEAQELINELMRQVRDLSLNLRPAMLDNLGLLETLLWHFDKYTTQTQVQVNFKHTGLRRRFPPEMNTAAYRIVQEALTNVVRHAGVNEVSVRALVDQDVLRLRIEDKGTGFDTKILPIGISGGLYGMRERALSLGGKLTVESTPAVGTIVTAELPISYDRIEHEGEQE